MSIPLVQNNEKDSINTSIIAIKKNLERINSILGLVDSGSDIDTSEFVKKSDIVDVVQSGNMNPVTSNAVVPVDTVTSGNMQSVTSNAVSGLFKLLWSNSSPSSSFSAQSISIPTMNDYSMLLVILNWATYSQFAINQVLIIKGQSSSQFNVMTYDINGSTIYSVARNVTISNNQINITDGTIWSGVNKGGTRNDICIPARIYGIK